MFDLTVPLKRWLPTTATPRTAAPAAAATANSRLRRRRRPPSPSPWRAARAQGARRAREARGVRRTPPPPPPTDARPPTTTVEATATAACAAGTGRGRGRARTSSEPAAEASARARRGAAREDLSPAVDGLRGGLLVFAVVDFVAASGFEGVEGLGFEIPAALDPEPSLLAAAPTAAKMRSAKPVLTRLAVSSAAVGRSRSGRFPC